MRSLAVILLALAGSSLPAEAQHEGHVGGSMTGPLGISAHRMGSGTTWIPDAVTLPSHDLMLGSWMLMLHGVLFVQYQWQGGPRGADQLGSINWAMLGIERSFAGGRAQLRFMPSLEAWTVGNCGYPLLLQSGGTCKGSSLDRQHPHDFFNELAIKYERPISSKVAVLLYGGPSGEPALGPVAYMHRPSAMDDPQAPLGHHWQDATHVSFGVMTGGIFTRTTRVEASIFNGREANEFRWGLERIHFNSASARVTYNPDPNWSMSAGYGKIGGHFPALPDLSMRRFVASAMHGRATAGGQMTTTAIYGVNYHQGSSRGSRSALLEHETIAGKYTLFGRLELVEKSAFELGVPGAAVDHSQHGGEEELFRIGATSLGFVRDIRVGGVKLGLGARGTVNVIPSSLEPYFGSRAPLGAMLFTRVRPAGRT